MAKIDTQLMTKTAEKPYPLGRLEKIHLPYRIGIIIIPVLYGVIIN